MFFLTLLGYTYIPAIDKIVMYISYFRRSTSQGNRKTLNSSAEMCCSGEWCTSVHHFSVISLFKKFGWCYTKKNYKPIFCVNTPKFHIFNRTGLGAYLSRSTGLVSLFNGISIFVGYSMPKPFSEKNSNGTMLSIVGRIRGVHTFSKGICPKVNVVAWLEYELAYYDYAVHRFNH